MISRPDQYVGIDTYTGNFSTKPIKIGFQPDLVWLKSRESTFSHYLRPFTLKTKLLQTNSTAAEITSTTGITSFDSDGFTEVMVLEQMQATMTWLHGVGRETGGNKNTFNVDGVG